MAESAKDRAETDNGKKPLLELSTLAPERPHILIDGKRYEMAVPEDFGLIEQARFARLSRQVNEMGLSQSLDSLDEEQAERVSGLLREMVASVLPGIPGEMLDKLTDQHALRIVEVFTKAVGPRTPSNRKARRRTGARSSPASSASTEDAPSTG